MWSTILIFIGSPFSRLLEVSNKQLVLTKITAICVVFNVALNILLIPKFSYVAASTITVLSELIAITLILKTVTSMGYGLTKNQIFFFIKTLVASLAMSLTILVLYGLNLFLLIIIAMIVYFFVLFLIKGFDDDDFNLFKKIVGR